MGVLPSTQPVATFGSSVMLSSFDMACTLLVGALRGGAGGDHTMVAKWCAGTRQGILGIYEMILTPTKHMGARIKPSHYIYFSLYIYISLSLYIIYINL